MGLLALTNCTSRDRHTNEKKTVRTVVVVVVVLKKMHRKSSRVLREFVSCPPSCSSSFRPSAAVSFDVCRARELKRLLSSNLRQCRCRRPLCWRHSRVSSSDDTHHTNTRRYCWRTGVFLTEECSSFDVSAGRNEMRPRDFCVIVCTACITLRNVSFVKSILSIYPTKSNTTTKSRLVDFDTRVSVFRYDASCPFARATSPE